MAQTQRVTTADGVTIAFDEQGSGPDVVFLHGITEQRGFWAPITDRLVSDFRCIRVDFHGHGESSHLPSYGSDGFFTDLGTVIAATSASPPIVVGHSLGGVIATAASGISMTGPVVCVDQPLQMTDFAKIVHPRAARLRDPATYGDALMEEKIALGLDLVAEPTYSTLESATRASDQAVVLGTWSVMLDGDEEAMRAADAALENVLTSITQPYLALHGSPLDPEYRAWVESTIPSAMVEAWPGLGHWLHLVDVDRFVDRVRTFVAEAG